MSAAIADSVASSAACAAAACVSAVCAAVTAANRPAAAAATRCGGVMAAFSSSAAAVPGLRRAVAVFVWAAADSSCTYEIAEARHLIIRQGKLNLLNWKILGVFLGTFSLPGYRYRYFVMRSTDL